MTSTAATGRDWVQGRERVLVGVDGSADGLRAVRYGTVMATERGAVLHLVHAVDDAALAGAWGVVYDPTTLQEAGRAAVDEAVAEARAAGVDEGAVHGEVLLGSAPAVLSRQAEGAALLVVGRRSVSGLERMFVGSTSVAVGEAAPCPVVVISDAANPGRTGSHGRIVVGVGTREHSASTLAWAFAEAAVRGAAVHVVHVARASEVAATHGELGRAAAQGLDDLLAPLRQAHPGVEATVEVAGGEPVDELVTRSSSADLLVLGAERPRLLGLRLGGVMRAVLAHAACPVVLVK